MSSFRQGFLPTTSELLDGHGLSLEILLETAIESEISGLANGTYFEMAIEMAKLSEIDLA